jgi:hypothetical protein
MAMPKDITITGEFRPPRSDRTQHRAEIAATSRPDVVALRSTLRPDEPLPLTAKQLRELAGGVARGDYDDILVRRT